MGSIFRRRWCVMSTCLYLSQLRELSEQRSGDFGIARLGGVAVLDIQRLVCQPSDVAWDAITSHPFFVLLHPSTLPFIHLQSAHALGDILVIVPHHLMAAPSDLQATVQRRVLDVLAEQIMLGGLASSTSMEICRLASRHCTKFYKHQVIPYSPAGKQYWRYSVASAGLRIPTFLHN